VQVCFPEFYSLGNLLGFDVSPGIEEIGDHSDPVEKRFGDLDVLAFWLGGWADELGPSVQIFQN